jgi:signal transduction histidine kinase
MQQKQLYFNVDTAKLEDSLVICDEARLSRVLMNLINNAYDYTPAGGGVMVTLQQKGPRYHQRKTEHGRLAFKTYADYEFRVHDTGKGMDAKEAAEAMAPFDGERTTKELLEKGRGLHIVRNIVQMMNGQLQVVTTQGQGTEVILSLTLPLAPK